MRVWIDANADGFSQSAELYTLASLGITSISTAYNNVSYQISGNDIKQESTFTMNGNSYTSVDAWFAYDPLNSEFVGDYELDIRTLFLPELRGYGWLPDLHVAMSQNADLLTKVEEIAAEDLSSLFSESFDLRGKVAALMYEWAGVEGVSSTARGPYFDARNLGVLEAFMGEYFRDSAVSQANPIAVPFLQKAWETALDMTIGRLAAQVGIAEEIISNAAYNPATDKYDGAPFLNFSGIEGLAVTLGANNGSLQAIHAWKSIFSIIDHAIGLDNLSAGDEAALMAIVHDSTGTDFLTFELLSPANPDVFWGTAFTDALSGNSASNIIIGYGGGDTIYGYGGDDVFYFSTGFVGVSGQYDVLTEEVDGGTDMLRFTGIAASDLRMWSTTGHTYFSIDGSPNDILKVVHSYPYPNTGMDINSRIERIVFDDGTTWDLTLGLNMVDTDAGHSLLGTSANDVLDGRGGNDGLEGYDGNDILYGGDGDDYLLSGGVGNDILDGGSGNDSLDGGADTDTVSYLTATSGVNVSLAVTSAQVTGGAGTDTITNVENLTGSAYGDLLIGNSGDNVIDGDVGDDIIEGGVGDDTLIGGAGTDRLSYANAVSGATVNLATTTAQVTGGAGTDTVSGFENLTGSAYNDTLTGDAGANVIEGGAGNDVLNGAGGADTLSYATATAGVTVNLATTTAQNTGGAGTDTISNFENLTGSAFNDTLTGNGSANVIEGGAGNDTINGGSGTDTVTYVNATAGVTVNLTTTTAQNTVGAGTDTISSCENLTGSAFNDTLTGNASANVIDGGAGDDILNGAGGTDTLTYASAGAAVTVSLALTSAQNTGGAGTDTVSNFEKLTGSSYDDTLTGNSAANTISGGNGSDTIYGGSGNDTLLGGDGNDLLYGESGLDAMTGGLGADTFMFQAASAYSNIDTIADFSVAQGDALNLASLLSSYDPLTQAITDFVMLATSGSNTTVSVDRDGTGATYGFTQIATLTGVTGLTDEAALVASGNLIVA